MRSINSGMSLRKKIHQGGWVAEDGKKKCRIIPCSIDKFKTISLFPKKVDQVHLTLIHAVIFPFILFQHLEFSFL